MIEQAFRSTRVARRLQGSLLGVGFDDLVAYLVERGHPVSTIQVYVQSAEHFINWLQRTHRTIESVDETVVQRFLKNHLPHCQCPLPCCTTVHQVRASLHHLLVILRKTKRIQRLVQPEATPASTLVDRFVAHLHNERGAAVATCAISARIAREFLADQFQGGEINFAHVTASGIVSFFAERGDRWTPDSTKVAASCLRRFLRYLVMIGRVDARLVYAVPKIAGWRLASVPRFLTEKQVNALLHAFDRSTSVGLRGYATTMCLARLGLRACEVSALTLDDIDWRGGTITVPATKSRREDTLPLPKSVARAIAAYLLRGRPTVDTRQLFVRHATPAGATGPAIVRIAASNGGKLAGFSDRMVSPNVLRHTIATRLIHSGATMKEIADVLRHRSIDTAAIYAKVDMDMLRKVAAPWPGRGR